MTGERKTSLMDIVSLYQRSLKSIIDDTPLRDVFARLYEFGLLHYYRHELSLKAGKFTADFCIGGLEDYFGLKGCAGEEKVIADLLAHLREDDVFFDIGAFMRLYSGFVASTFETVDIVAFDPHSTNLKRTRRNVFLNGDEIQTFNVALGPETEIVGFDLESRDDSVLTVNEGASHFVAQYTLDDLLQTSGIQTPTVLKIDVEGAELGLLRGAPETLTNVRLVYCEVHKTDIESYEEVDSILKSKGFTIERLQESPETYQLRALRE